MKSRIRIFLEKGGILVLTSMNLEEKGLILKSSILLWKRGFIWADKSVFLLQKRGFILDWKVKCFIAKNWLFWCEKSVFCHKKGVIFKLEKQDGYH